MTDLEFNKFLCSVVQDMTGLTSFDSHFTVQLFLQILIYITDVV